MLAVGSCGLMARQSMRTGDSCTWLRSREVREAFRFMNRSAATIRPVTIMTVELTCARDDQRVARGIVTHKSQSPGRAKYHHG